MGMTFSLKNFAKAEFIGWKKTEVIALTLIFTFIFINAIIVKDNLVAVVSAICGITYSTMAGKGKISCFLFGLTGTFCYSYLSFKNALFGNLLLYAGYYFPMQVIGLFFWSKNLKKEAQEIVKTKLTNKKRVKYFFIAFISCLVGIYILHILNDKNPICDGITTVLSLFGMYFTVKRCIEQWVIWIVVNGLSAIMWLQVVLQGEKVFSTFIMWVVYLILAIYFLFEWCKELNSKKHLTR